MTHHAYFVTGRKEEGIATARRFAERTLSLSGLDNPDLTVLPYTFFSIEDARKLSTLANQTPLSHAQKCLIIALDRFSHEAQNALLKLFEEPPVSTVLILVLPHEGILLPTLRSRLLELPSEEGKQGIVVSEFVSTFLGASKPEQMKLVASLIEKSKSDKEETKQQARTDAVLLAEGLIRSAHAQYEKKPTPELLAFLSDMNRFIPILHERSAPLKLIFEHILLVLPSKI